MWIGGCLRLELSQRGRGRTVASKISAVETFWSTTDSGPPWHSLPSNSIDLSRSSNTQHLQSPANNGAHLYKDLAMVISCGFFFSIECLCLPDFPLPCPRVAWAPIYENYPRDLDDRPSDMSCGGRTWAGSGDTRHPFTFDLEAPFFTPRMMAWASPESTKVPWWIALPLGEIDPSKSVC
ncbi:hypothetical protein BJY00DRAFT_160930 [Aspergillus carlsbadensis]|nr:hypothetical protein BJY00DRAFT_160930 [Aspergillus carlsbadensis]